MEATCDQRDACALTASVIEKLYACGVRDFCISPGSRNAPFIAALSGEPRVSCHFWPEERSAAFFALGRARRDNRPVAVVTTSGTAAGELLPAAMEAHYAGVPLVLLTADRPRRFRHSGAPQSAVQNGIFGVYAETIDIEGGEILDLEEWERCSPLHINVCLEEVYDRQEALALNLVEEEESPLGFEGIPEIMDAFLACVSRPVAIAGTLLAKDREAVAEFLSASQIPVYLECCSGLRGDPRLEKSRIHHAESIAEGDYDAILRIGGVPTLRLWRDFENRAGEMTILSVSHLPFPGLSWGGVTYVEDLSLFFQEAVPRRFSLEKYRALLERDKLRRHRFDSIAEKETSAEPSLMRALSHLIPEEAHVYLGNSLPIREWDMSAAGFHPECFASRGLNGIDGQLSAFFGLCQKDKENWAVIGDLTALYDMAAPWILQQMKDYSINIVVINNSGGKIFSRLMKDPVYQNPHSLSFKPLAEMWGLHYEKWHLVPESVLAAAPHRFIELIPDNEASDRFWTSWKSGL